MKCLHLWKNLENDYIAFFKNISIIYWMAHVYRKN